MQTALIVEEQGRAILTLGSSFALLLQYCMTASHMQNAECIVYRGEQESTKTVELLKIILHVSMLKRDKLSYLCNRWLLSQLNFHNF